MDFLLEEPWLPGRDERTLMYMVFGLHDGALE